MKWSLRIVVVIVALMLLGTTAGCGGHMDGMCVAEGTMIDTPAGAVAVEEIDVGDRVWCVAPDGNREVGEVQAVFERRARRLVSIECEDGRDLRVTPQHRVRTMHGWIPAGELTTESMLAPGDAPRIASISRVDESRRVFDLAVTPHANYIAEGFVLHNKTIIPPLRQRDVVGLWVVFLHDNTSTYLMELTEDGTGRLSTRGSRSTHEVPIHEWAIDGQHLTMSFSPPGWPESPWRAEGTLDRSRTGGVLEQPGFSKRRLHMIRPDALRDDLKHLEEFKDRDEAGREPSISE